MAITEANLIMGTHMRMKVHAFLRDHPGTHKFNEIAESTGAASHTVRIALKNTVDAGTVEKTREGNTFLYRWVGPR